MNVEYLDHAVALGHDFVSRVVARVIRDARPDRVAGAQRDAALVEVAQPLLACSGSCKQAR